MGRNDTPRQAGARVVLEAAARQSSSGSDRSKSSFRSVSRQVGFNNHQSVANLVHSPALATSPHAHTGKPGPVPVLNEDQREIVAGKVLFQHIQGDAWDQQAIIEWVSEVFGVSVSPSWVTRLAQRFHVSSKVVRLQQHVPDKSETKSKITSTLKFIDNLDLQAESVVAIDASGFSINIGNPRGYGPSGRFVCCLPSHY